MLRTRRGFARVALEEQIDGIVPVYHYGNSQVTDRRLHCAAAVALSVRHRSVFGTACVLQVLVFTDPRQPLNDGKPSVHHLLFPTRWRCMRVLTDEEMMFMLFPLIISFERRCWTLGPAAGRLWAASGAQRWASSTAGALLGWPSLSNSSCVLAS